MSAESTSWTQWALNTGPVTGTTVSKAAAPTTNGYDPNNFPNGNINDTIKFDATTGPISKIPLEASVSSTSTTATGANSPSKNFQKSMSMSSLMSHGLHDTYITDPQNVPKNGNNGNHASMNAAASMPAPGNPFMSDNSGPSLGGGINGINCINGSNGGSLDQQNSVNSINDSNHNGSTGSNGGMNGASNNSAQNNGGELSAELMEALGLTPEMMNANAAPNNLMHQQSVMSTRTNSSAGSEFIEQTLSMISGKKPFGGDDSSHNTFSRSNSNMRIDGHNGNSNRASAAHNAAPVFTGGNNSFSRESGIERERTSKMSGRQTSSGQQAPGQGPSSGFVVPVVSDDDVNDWVRKNKLDERCRRDILVLSNRLRWRVVGEGDIDLTRTRNPSVCAIMRIKFARTAEMKNEPFPQETTFSADGTMVQGNNHNTVSRGVSVCSASMDDKTKFPETKTSEPEAAAFVGDTFNERVKQELMSCPMGVISVVRSSEGYTRLLQRINEDYEQNKILSASRVAPQKLDTKNVHSDLFMSECLGPVRMQRDFVRQCQMRVFIQDFAFNFADTTKEMLLNANVIRKSVILDKWARRAKKNAEENGKDTEDLLNVPDPGEILLSENDVEHILKSENLVDMFITQNRLDDGAAKAIKNAPPNVQEIILEEGEIQNANNPSACVISRVKKLKEALDGGRHGYGGYHGSGGGYHRSNSMGGGGGGDHHNGMSGKTMGGTVYLQKGGAASMGGKEYGGGYGKGGKAGYGPYGGGSGKMHGEKMGQWGGKLGQQYSRSWSTDSVMSQMSMPSIPNQMSNVSLSSQLSHQVSANTMSPGMSPMGQNPMGQIGNQMGGQMGGQQQMQMAPMQQQMSPGMMPAGTMAPMSPHADYGMIIGPPAVGQLPMGLQAPMGQPQQQIGWLDAPQNQPMQGNQMQPMNQNGMSPVMNDFSQQQQQPQMMAQQPGCQPQMMNQMPMDCPGQQLLNQLQMDPGQPMMPNQMDPNQQIPNQVQQMPNQQMGPNQQMPNPNQMSSWVQNDPNQQNAMMNIGQMNGMSGQMNPGMSPGMAPMAQVQTGPIRTMSHNFRSSPMGGGTTQWVDMNTMNSPQGMNMNMNNPPQQVIMTTMNSPMMVQGQQMQQPMMVQGQQQMMGQQIQSVQIMGQQNMQQNVQTMQPNGQTMQQGGQTMQQNGQIMGQQQQQTGQQNVVPQQTNTQTDVAQQQQNGGQQNGGQQNGGQQTEQNGGQQDSSNGQQQTQDASTGQQQTEDPNNQNGENQENNDPLTQQGIDEIFTSLTHTNSPTLLMHHTSVLSQASSAGEFSKELSQNLQRESSFNVPASPNVALSNNNASSSDVNAVAANATLNASNSATLTDSPNQAALNGPLTTTMGGANVTIMGGAQKLVHDTSFASQGSGDSSGSATAIADLLSSVLGPEAHSQLFGQS